MFIIIRYFNGWIYRKKGKSLPKRSYDKSFVDPKIAILMVGILGTEENVVNNKKLLSIY